MNESLRRTKSSTIILGVLMLLLGIGFMIWPGASTEFLILCIGWGFVIAGIATFVGFFVNSETHSAWDIVLAICEFVLGLLILFFPFAFTGVFFIFLGVVVFVTGIFDIIDALTLVGVKGSLWGLWLTLGIMTLLCGVFMFINPLIWAFALMWVAGFVLIFDGITEIVAGAMM